MRQEQGSGTWKTRTAAAIVLATVGIAGCRIDSNKNGDADNVKIATPFGGMQVKTDTADVLTGIGLPAYPGATLVKKHRDGNKEDNNGSADINMSFGTFQLRIKAAEYRTPDSPEKVAAFYRKALQRFGNVLQCDNKKPVGALTHTSEGLTCDDNDHAAGDTKVHGNFSDDDAKTQFKAGSKKHQHIVDINPEAGGTKFGLVALDLPTDFHFGTSGDKEDKSDEQ